MSYCPQCGALNRPGARFCNICGTRLESAPAELAEMIEARVQGAAPAAPLSAETALPTLPPADDPAEYAEAHAAEPVPPFAPAQPVVLVLEAAPDAAPDAVPDVAPDAVPDAAPEQALAAPVVSAAPVVEPVDEPEAELVAAPVVEPVVELAAEVVGNLEPVAETAPAPDVSDVLPTPPALLPVEFSAGDVLDGQFWVVETLLADTVGASRYIVEDRAHCPFCHDPVQPSLDEAYCDNCGAHLLGADLAWTRWLAVPLPAGAPAADTSDGADDWASDGARIVQQNGVALLLKPLPAPGAAADTAAAQPNAPAGALQPDEPTQPATPLVFPFARGVGLLVGQRSDVGLLRAGNPDEDSLFALTLSLITDSLAAPTVGLFFVADGMGGHGDGEVASRIAAEAISALLVQSLALPILQGQQMGDQTIANLIDAAIQTANRRIVEQGTRLHSNMGTTLTLAFVYNATAYIANIGDSRTYLWGADGLRAVTADHSAVYALWKAGEITEQELYDHPMRSGITRSLGQAGEVAVDYYRETLAPGDMLLLCCDGLWEMIRSEGIADVLMAGLTTPQAICDELVSRANLAGGEDNVSVIVVRALA